MTDRKMASWGCHQCGRIDQGLWLWLARRRSIQHERSAHGRSVYDEPNPHEDSHRAFTD